MKKFKFKDGTVITANTAEEAKDLHEITINSKDRNKIIKNKIKHCLPKVYKTKDINSNSFCVYYPNVKNITSTEDYGELIDCLEIFRNISKYKSMGERLVVTITDNELSDTTLNKWKTMAIFISDSDKQKICKKINEVVDSVAEKYGLTIEEKAKKYYDGSYTWHLTRGKFGSYAPVVIDIDLDSFIGFSVHNVEKGNNTRKRSIATFETFKKNFLEACRTTISEKSVTAAFPFDKKEEMAEEYVLIPVNQIVNKSWLLKYKRLLIINENTVGIKSGLKKEKLARTIQKMNKLIHEDI